MSALRAGSINGSQIFIARHMVVLREGLQQENAVAKSSEPTNGWKDLPFTVDAALLEELGQRLISEHMEITEQ